MRGYLRDAHVWFWYLVGSERLPQPLRERVDGTPGHCWLSPISVRELGLLARRGRVEIPGSYRAWVGESTPDSPGARGSRSSREAGSSHETGRLNGAPEPGR